MPLHHIEKWTSQFFDATSLNQEGFVSHLSHGGEPCPGNSTKKGQQGTQSESSDEGEGESNGDGILLTGWEQQDRQCLVIVDISGVHQLWINWCQCKTAAEPHIQLLRNRLFPASIKRPSTAFTFSLLDHFYIDSVECKTSASSFFSKLQRYFYRELMRTSRAWRCHRACIFGPLFILNYFHFLLSNFISLSFSHFLKEHKLWFHSISSGCNRLLIFEI